MITKSEQDWTVGNSVKVGFLTLSVLAVIPTPGDSKPDAYVLASSKAFYEFVPHNGLNKITERAALDLIAAGKAAAKRQADAAIQQAAARAAHTAAINRLVAA